MFTKSISQEQFIRMNALTPVVNCTQIVQGRRHRFAHWWCQINYQLTRFITLKQSTVTSIKSYGWSSKEHTNFDALRPAAKNLPQKSKRRHRHGDKCVINQRQADAGATSIDLGA